MYGGMMEVEMHSLEPAYIPVHQAFRDHPPAPNRTPRKLMNNCTLYVTLYCWEAHPTVSWADLIQMASATAIEMAGGPVIKMKPHGFALAQNLYISHVLLVLVCSLFFFLWPHFPLWDIVGISPFSRSIGHWICTS